MQETSLQSPTETSDSAYREMETSRQSPARPDQSPKQSGQYYGYPAAASPKALPSQCCCRPAGQSCSPNLFHNLAESCAVLHRVAIGRKVGPMVITEVHDA